MQGGAARIRELPRLRRQIHSGLLAAVDPKLNLENLELGFTSCEQSRPFGVWPHVALRRGAHQGCDAGFVVVLFGLEIQRGLSISFERGRLALSDS